MQTSEAQPSDMGARLRASVERKKAEIRAGHTTITLTMPRGPIGRHTVDLTTLTPKARALAEAIYCTDRRWIRVRSVDTARTLYRGNVDFYVTADQADQPVTSIWESWEDCERRTAGDKPIAALLEYEATKMPAWVPVDDFDQDLPSTELARAEDAVTRDQALSILSEKVPGHGITADQWLRNATRGLHGFPSPVRHNGRVSLWSRPDVQRFADRLDAIRAAGGALAQAEAQTVAAKADLRALIGSAGLPEDLTGRLAGVTRTTIRRWTAPSASNDQQ